MRTTRRGLGSVLRMTARRWTSSGDGLIEKPGDEVIVLGDFNTISDSDRAMLDHFAHGTSLEWLSAHLPCTAYLGSPSYMHDDSPGLLSETFSGFEKLPTGLVPVEAKIE